MVLSLISNTKYIQIRRIGDFCTSSIGSIETEQIKTIKKEKNMDMKKNMIMKMLLLLGSLHYVTAWASNS
jgi:hypothetical protein